MKVIKYKVEVFEGTMDWDHGMGQWIDEIFIPEKKLCFNAIKGLNIFGAEISRATRDKQEIEIPDEIARSLGMLLKVTEEINKEKETLLQEIKKKKILEDNK